MKNLSYLFTNFCKIFLVVMALVNEAKAQNANKVGCISGDCQNGYGVEFIDGKYKYEGNFIDGWWNGKGTYTYLDESPFDKFIGEFKNNTRVGKGILIYKNGGRYEGDFVYSKSENGIYIWANGDRYVGQFFDYKKNGFGKVYNKDNIIIREGIWDDDVWVAYTMEEYKTNSWAKVNKYHESLPLNKPQDINCLCREKDRYVTMGNRRVEKVEKRETVYQSATNSYYDYVTYEYKTIEPEGIWVTGDLINKCNYAIIIKGAKRSVKKNLVYYEDYSIEIPPNSKTESKAITDYKAIVADGINYYGKLNVNICDEATVRSETQYSQFFIYNASSSVINNNKSTSNSNTATNSTVNTSKVVTSITKEKLYDDGMTSYFSKDYTTALQLFMQSAEKGYAPAQFYIGYMYENEKGVPKNITEAVKWYKKASDQGDNNAQATLGDIYMKGNGVTKNTEEAVKLFRKAAAQGNYYAKDKLKELGY